MDRVSYFAVPSGQITANTFPKDTDAPTALFHKTLANLASFPKSRAFLPTIIAVGAALGILVYYVATRIFSSNPNTPPNFDPIQTASAASPEKDQLLEQLRQAQEEAKNAREQSQRQCESSIQQSTDQVAALLASLGQPVIPLNTDPNE